MIKLKFLTFLFTCIFISVGCKTRLNRMSNYHSLNASYLKTDTDVLYYFNVTSSGSTRSEFKNSTKIFILKQLLYEGFLQNGIKVSPLLIDSELQEKFKSKEFKYLIQLSNSIGLIKQIDINKKIKLEEAQLYQLSTILAIDKIKLDLETKKLLQGF